MSVKFNKVVKIGSILHIQRIVVFILSYLRMFWSHCLASIFTSNLHTVAYIQYTYQIPAFISWIPEGILPKLGLTFRNTETFFSSVKVSEDLNDIEELRDILCCPGVRALLQVRSPVPLFKGTLAGDFGASGFFKFRFQATTYTAATQIPAVTYTAGNRIPCYHIYGSKSVFLLSHTQQWSDSLLSHRLYSGESNS